MGLWRQRCDDIYRPNMKLCRYIATLTLRLPLRLPAGLQPERESLGQAWPYKKPYHLTPTTPNPRLGDPSVVRPPPRGTGNQVTREERAAPRSDMQRR